MLKEVSYINFVCECMCHSQAVEEAAARKRSKEEKMKNNKPRESIVQAAINKKDGTEEKEPPAPTKAKRMGKNALKVSKSFSSFAERRGVLGSIIMYYFLCF